jgi:hypothetical protein
MRSNVKHTQNYGGPYICQKTYTINVYCNEHSRGDQAAAWRRFLRHRCGRKHNARALSEARAMMIDEYG